MNRYRQNIQKQNSNARKNSAMEEYGIGVKIQTTDQKRLRSKSKSQKEILIAKNKKLPEPFKASHSITRELKSPKHKQLNSGKKEGQFFQIWQKNSTYPDNNLSSFDGQKTSAFGDDPKINKENTPSKVINKIIIRPQTYLSDRVQAIELKQRLKKSTSMQNLIEQKFLHQSQNTKNQVSNIPIENNKESKNQYDSTKYNWRLSKSKEKLEKQKSLSALSCKAKLIFDLKKKDAQKQKLILDSSTEYKSTDRVKLKSQQVLSFNIKGHRRENSETLGKKINLQEKLSYTFGSDVMNSLHLN